MKNTTVKGYFFFIPRDSAFRQDRSVSDQNAVAVVDLMLDDLGRPAGEGPDPGLEGLVLPAYLDLLKPPGLPGTAQQRKTALFRFIFPGAAEELRIQHDHIAPLTVEGDDPAGDADHVGGHAHAFFLMGSQGIQQVPGSLQILFSSRGRFPGQENGVVNDGLDHEKTSFHRQIKRRLPRRPTDSV